jgi:hypothetical protein
LRDRYPNVEANKKHTSEEANNTQAEWGDVTVLALDAWHGFALALRAALDHVTTPNVMVLPHDLVSLSAH